MCQSEAPVPHSPIAGGEDGFGVPSELGREIRRARFGLQLVYDCEPGAFVDIEARVRDAITEFVCNELGSAVIALDLTEHVKLGARGAIADA